MAANMAVKRAKKAQKHKAKLAARRKLELIEGSLLGQVKTAASMPVQLCLVHGDLTEGGMVNILLIRGASPYRVAVAGFLVDLHCLGIKDVMFTWMGAEEFARYSEAMGETAPIDTIELQDARKLLRDAAAWAESIGFAPHKDFVAVERAFGDVDCDASTRRYTFGVNGKPLYVPGPTETRAQIRQRIEQLRRRLGPDGFDCMVEV
ncbi:MAG: hypothetical protein HY243_16150 [Proteobacteria bacterium]|nr:hypothetical protein [Pseudomonadota bacterium]